MTARTCARSLSANFAAEDAASQADVRKGPTSVGLVILATEGCQQLKAAAAPTYRTASYRAVVAFSWKGALANECDHADVPPHHHWANVHTVVFLQTDLQSEWC